MPAEPMIAVRTESSADDLMLSDGTTINDLVQLEHRRVATRLSSDPEIFEREMERIFDRVWVFVAHESEIPNKGDFVTRYIGKDPVIVTRAAGGEVHVLLNVCTHRAGMVCRAERGTTTKFECGYHGWTYKNTGQLLGIPTQRMVYGDRLDKKALGLKQARVGVTNGLIFATWNRDGPSLEEYLGDMGLYYDLVFGLTEQGMEVAGPPQRWIVPANWKIAAENFSVDNTHPLTLHKFVFDMKLLPDLDPSGLQSLTLVSDPSWGHALMAGLTPRFDGMPERDAIDITCAVLNIPPDLVPQVHERLVTEQQRRAFLTALPSIGTVFPNFAYININLPTERGQSPFAIPHLVSIRVYHPRSAGEMEIWSWALVHKEAPPEVKRMAALAVLQTFGPGGTFEQDDAAVWSGIQRGISGVQGRKQMNNYAATEDPIESDLPGVVRPCGTADDTILEFYGRWRDLMVSDSARCGPSVHGAGHV